MAEFNIYVDPEAADIVFRSGLPIVMCGLELANMARITGPMVDAIRQNNPTADMVYRLFEHYRDGDLETGLNMFDSTAVGYLLAPELYTTVDCFVGIETASPLTRGMTVATWRTAWAAPPMQRSAPLWTLPASRSCSWMPWPRPTAYREPTAALWLYDEE